MTLRLLNANKLENMTMNEAMDYICDAETEFNVDELVDQIHELACQNESIQYQFAITDVLDILQVMIDDCAA